MPNTVIQSENNKSRTCMNISFVLSKGKKLGGGIVWAVRLAGRLASCGENVSVIEHSLVGRGFDIDAGAEVKKVLCGGKAATKARKRDIKEYCRSYREILPAVVFPNWDYAPYAVCAELSKENPEEIRVIGMAHTDADFYYEWLTYYEPIIHVFIVVSREIECTLRTLLPERKKDIFLLTYGVDVPERLLRGYSKEKEPISLLYAGRINEGQKNIFALVRLADLLGRDGVDFTLNIVGEGEEDQALAERISELDEKTRRRVSTKREIRHDDMAALWQGADICVLLSRTEGTSIAMLEAMAAGCVPVVTRVSGTESVIATGENGYIVEMGDTAQAAKIIGELARNKKKLADIGKNAHKTVAERFRYEEYVREMRTLIEKAQGRPSRKWPAGRKVISERPVRKWMKRVKMRAEYLAMQHGARMLGRIRKRIGEKPYIRIRALLKKGRGEK